MDDDLISEMIEPRRPVRTDHGRRARLLTTVATVALAAAGVTSLTTSALFTDNATMSGTEFTTGTVRISPTMSQTVTLGNLNLAPGDTSYGAVLVENAGSLEHRYTLSAGATNGQAADLAGELELRVYAADSATTNVSAACRAGGVAALDLLTTLDGVPVASTAVLGSTTPGQDAGPGGGDRVLAATTSETLCVAATLPLATDNAFQATTTSLVLSFDAEQTANNP